MAIDWMQNLPDQQDNNLDFLNNLPDLEGLPDKGETPSFGSRIGEFSEGLLGFGKSLIESGFGNPMGMNPFINSNGVRAGKDIVSGMVLDPARELFTGHPLRAGAKFLGMNPDAIYEDYQAGNYGALAGDIGPQALMGLLGSRLARGAKVKAPRVDVLSKETPIPGEPLRLNAGPQAKPPTIQPPRQLGEARANVTRQLPARGETSINSPGFIAGERGIVDKSLTYPFDWNEQFRSLGGKALTPEDIAEIARVRPDLTPDQIMAMINRRGTPDFTNELGAKNTLDIAANYPNNTQYGIAKINPNIEEFARVPEYVARDLAFEADQWHQGIDPVKIETLQDVYNERIANKRWYEDELAEALGEKVPDLNEIRDIKSDLNQPLFPLRKPEIRVNTFPESRGYGELNSGYGKDASGRYRMGSPDSPIENLIVHEPPNRNVPMGMRGGELPPSTLEQPKGGRVVNAPENLTRQNLDPNSVDVTNRALSPEGLGQRVVPPRKFPNMREGEARLEPTRTNPEVMARIKQSVRDVGDSEPVLVKAVNSKNPAIKQAAYDYIREPEKSKYNPFRFLSFAGTELKGMGASGAELYRKASRFTQLERFNLKDWAEPYKNAVTKLSKKEQENFGAYVEGKLPIPNESVRTAVDSWRNAEQSAGKSAENVGMVIEDSAGNKVPFTRISRNYWPRRLSKEALEALPTKIDQMVAEGIKRSDAEKIVANARKFGELILPAQHKRASRLFEYRNDALSGLEHLENMARASARVQEFGRKDIAGHSDGILGLIENTSNPGRAYDIMKRIVGRDEKVNKNLDNFVRSARTAVSWLRLQNYGISSIIGNQLPNMLRANMGQYIKSLGGFVGRNRAITDHSAAAMDISHGVFEQTSKLNPMKVYGGNLSENIVRGQAAGIGQGMANTYFRELKKNPFNIDAKKQLFELILEDPDMLVNQPALTEPQLRMAAARSAELSQGLTNPVNLPMWASEPVSGFGTTLAQLMLIFKKQAAIQSKMLYDSFKRNPVKTMALAGGMSQLAGGAIGAIKSGIIAGTRSAVSGRDFGETFEHEFGNRADWVGRYTGTDNEIINGTIDRAIQSWALGSALDLAMLALEPKALGEFIAGPVVGAAGDIGGNITHPTQLGREAMRMLPIPGGIGTGLQRELLPTRSQEIE